MIEHFTFGEDLGQDKVQDCIMKFNTFSEAEGVRPAGPPPLPPPHEDILD